MIRAVRLSTKLLCGALLLTTDAIAQTSDLNPTRSETDAFLAADEDQDTVLQFAEFKTFIRLMARTGQPTARQVKTFGAYRFAFRIADKNRDGVVSPLELRAADDTHRAGQTAEQN